MSFKWPGVQLKKTGLNEQRLVGEQDVKINLENRQSELASNAALNKANKDVYDDRQGSLAANAMMGQQGRIYGQGGRLKRRKTRRHRKSRKNRRTRRHRRS